jgi:alcohol dehydrogenase
LLEALESAGVDTTVYNGTVAELPISCIEESVAIGRSCAPQLIIGLGGGSCMDLAKLTALMLTHGGHVSDYYGELRVPGPVLPVIAVPTTAGTGSEVTPVAVLGDPERVLKVGVSSPYLIPRIAICDPELTLTCPRTLTAASGADALTHAIEAFTAVRRAHTSTLVPNHVFIGKNDLSDHHARLAIPAIGQHLRHAVEDGAEVEAREQMMFGALEAGLAFGAAGTAAAHAVQYPVGAYTHTAHGLGVAVMLPYVMAYNRPSCVREFADVALLLGVGTSDEGDETLADKAIQAVSDLFAAIGIPKTLSELGLPESKLRWTAEQALTIARLVKNNPRPLDECGMEQLVRAAFEGSWSAVGTIATQG